MTPEDPRHATLAGHSAGCRLMCCRRAMARYEKKRRLNAVQGITLAIPAIGAQRRIQALMAIGWTTTDIALAGGWSHRNRLMAILKGQKGRPCRWVERSTHDTIARVYAERCMVIPELTGPRRRSMARALALGYLPPLAWDDIDSLDARTHEITTDSTVDEVIVDRLLAGQRIDSTRAEKIETMRRWLASGGSQRELCRIHGWGENRYVTKDLVA